MMPRGGQLHPDRIAVVDEKERLSFTPNCGDKGRRGMAGA